jgi:hypothetical protein
LHDLQGEVPPEELQQTGLVAGHDEGQPSHVLGCSGFALLTSSRCRSLYRRGLDMSAVGWPAGNINALRPPSPVVAGGLVT